MVMRRQDCSKDKVLVAWLATEGGSARGDGRYILLMKSLSQLVSEMLPD